VLAATKTFLEQFCVQQVRRQWHDQSGAKPNHTCSAPPQATPLLTRRQDTQGGPAQPATASPGPVPWRAATSGPPAKCQRLLFPGKSCCEECGKRSRTFRDASDDMHYCQECWVAFYGRLPGCAISAVSVVQKAALGNPGNRISMDRRCKREGRITCQYCMGTFARSDHLKRHIEKGSCKARPK